MRKYEYLKTSSFLDKNLKSIDAAQKKLDAAIKEGIFPARGLKQRLFFIYYMLHMRRTISLARKGDHVSIADYFQLVEIWAKIFFRIYQPN